MKTNWLLSQNIFFFLNAVNTTIISFKIYFDSNSVENIIIYSLMFVVVSLIGSIIAPFFLGWMSLKTVFILGILVRAVLNFGLWGGQIWVDPILIGVISAISNTLVFLVLQTLNRDVAGENGMIKFAGLNILLAGILNIVQPAVITESVKMFDYSTIFLISGFIFSAIILFIVFSIKAGNTKMGNFVDLLKFKHKERGRVIWYLFLINLSIGIGYAFWFGLADVVIVKYLGSLDSWRNVMIVAMLIGVLLSQLLSKIKADSFNKLLAIISIGTLIYGIGPIIFIADMNISTFIVFCILKLCFDSICGQIIGSFITDLQDDDQDYEVYKSSYQQLTQIARNLGYLIPLVFAFFMFNKFGFEVLIIIYALISLFPLLFLRLYKQLYIQKNDR